MTHQATTQQDAKDHVKDLAQDVKTTASAMAEDRSARLRDNAAERVSTTADAANAAAQHFDPASMQAQAMRQIADHVDEFATRIRQSDLQTLAGEVGGFARRNPALFIGAAAVAGFAATRFLKARGPAHQTTYDAQDPWAAADHPSTISAANEEQRHG